MLKNEKVEIFYGNVIFLTCTQLFVKISKDSKF